MAETCALPPLPPVDARGTALAITRAMRSLDAQRACLEARSGTSAYVEWAQSLTILVERLDAMLAPLAPAVLDAPDRQRWIDGLERRG